MVIYLQTRVRGQVHSLQVKVKVRVQVQPQVQVQTKRFTGRLRPNCHVLLAPGVPPWIG